MSQLESTHSSSLGTPLLSSKCSVSTFPRDLPLLKAYRITMAPRLIAWSCWFILPVSVESWQGWSLSLQWDYHSESIWTTCDRALEYDSFFLTQAVDLTHQERASWPIDMGVSCESGIGESPILITWRTRDQSHDYKFPARAIRHPQYLICRTCTIKSHHQCKFYPWKSILVKLVVKKNTLKNRRGIRGGGTLNYHGADKIRSPSDTRTGRRFVQWQLSVFPGTVLSDTAMSLHIHVGCTEKEIRERFKKLALKWHPDKNFHNPDEAQKVMVYPSGV